MCQCFVGVLYFFGGVFLDVLVVLDRFAILDYDFFVKKFIFVKSCQNGVVTLLNKIRYSPLLRLVLCGDCWWLGFDFVEAGGFGAYEVTDAQTVRPYFDTYYWTVIMNNLC